MAVSQLGYLGIGAGNLADWEQYLCQALGLELFEQAEDGTIYYRMDEYHHRFAIYPDSLDDLKYVGWQTANRKEFEATKAKLLEIGVEYEQATPEELANRHVVDMVKFDLSGVPSEVYYGLHVLFERPFKSAVPMLTSFRTGELGLGHVGLNVDDVERAKKILMEGLGFRISDAFGAAGNEVFFHCNGREHTAVIAPYERGGPKRLQHFMLEVNSIDDVGFCIDRCEDMNVPIRSRLGRHTNDHMLSFYHYTPSGFYAEYGWGGRLIDDEKWQVSKYEKAAIWGHRRTAVTPVATMPPK